MWPLATSWVPMTMSTSPFSIAASSSRRRCTPPMMSLDIRIVRASGEARGDLLAEPLDARPDGDEALRVAAVRAVVRPLLGVAAMVAEEHAAEAVLDQPGRAVGALEAMAAGPAERERGIAPPVEEEERLLSLGQRLRDRGDQRRRQIATAVGRVLPHVDRRDLGKLRRRRSGRRGRCGV